jgi:hypothetical protein
VLSLLAKEHVNTTCGDRCFAHHHRFPSSHFTVDAARSYRQHGALARSAGADDSSISLIRLILQSGIQNKDERFLQLSSKTWSILGKRRNDYCVFQS